MCEHGKTVNTMRITFKELKDQIAKVVPKDIPYTVELEAGNIAIVTPVPAKFGGGDGLIGKIAKRVKLGLWASMLLLHCGVLEFACHGVSYKLIY